jgi:tetratricopeptide (TPR) repeat protein
VNDALKSFLLIVLLVLASAPACAERAPRTPDAPGRDLLPVSLPDLSRVDRSVREQVSRAHAALAARLQAESSEADVSGAYGALGMVLEAAEFHDAAEPSLLNAQALAPGEIRWPYYLGHLYQSRGELPEAKAAFTRVLDLRSDDLATLIWLGRISQDEGNWEQAQQYFERGAALAPEAIAVLAGLGRVALARRDYAAAARYFERALTVDAEAAESLHAPLAVAYRGLGDAARAARHERGWANRDILVPDALLQELDMLLDNGLSNELRGVRALEAKDWKSAAAYFERGLSVTDHHTPLGRSLRHKLGTALYLGGDQDRAAVHFQKVVDTAPATGVDEAAAKAHYSLAVMLMAKARYADAIGHFRGAVMYQPSYLEARIALAEALRRTGQVRASLSEYQAVLDRDPAAAQAMLGYAFALIRLGRYREAGSLLDEAVQVHRDRPEFAHMLARLLAVAPDDRVRDGQRAMRLIDDLLQGTRTTELGETLAMALAETGEYQRAVSVQRDVLAVVRRGGSEAAVRRVTGNLRLYESGRPNRTFWEDTPLP